MNDYLNHSTISLGKYRISSLSKPLGNGRYGAAVSIRSGRGSASTDRVLRFVPHFDCEDEAHHYAHAQGRAWVHQASLPTGGRPLHDGVA